MKHRHVVAAGAAVLAGVLSLTLAAGTSAHAQGVYDPAPITGAEEALGAPLPGKILSPDAAQGFDKNGENLQAYWVTNGNDEEPARFQVTDVAAGKVIFAQVLPQGEVSWGVSYSAAGQAAYVGTTDGTLYRWKRGAAAVETLGHAPEGEQIWRTVAAPDGTVYAGTYPSGLVLKFDPVTAELTNLGPSIAGVSYSRAFAVDSQYLWVGTQAPAKLVRIDRTTLERKEFALPAQYATSECVYDLSIPRPGLLTARITKDEDLLLIDTQNWTVLDTVEELNGRAVSSPDPDTGTFVLLRAQLAGQTSPHIVKYDLDDHTLVDTGWAPGGIPGSWAWVKLADQANFPGYSASFTYYNGRIYIYNLQTNKSLYFSEQSQGLTGSDNPIQMIAHGPDGKIYVSGFLTPAGMAQIDPVSGANTMLTGAGQVEGFAAVGSSLLLGSYPSAKLRVFDTSQPWKDGTNPTGGFQLGQYQDRPQVFADLGNGTVAVGSVAASGKLNGALSLWDVGAGTASVHAGIIPDQSIVSVLAHDGRLYIASSINGGYGTPPTASEAVVAEVDLTDPASPRIVRQVTPLSGARAINALTLTPEGTFLAIADSTLLELDPTDLAVVRSEELFRGTSPMYGVERNLAWHDGYWYAVASHSLWRIDPETWQVRELASGGIADLAQDDAGNLYYGRGTKLFRWNFSLTPEPQPPAPVLDAQDVQVGYGAQTAPVVVSVTPPAKNAGLVAGLLRWRVDRAAPSEPVEVSGTTTTLTVPIPSAELGTQTVDVEFVDRASGQVVAWDSAVITVVPATTEVVLDATAGTAQPGQAVTVTGTVTAQHGTIPGGTVTVTVPGHEPTSAVLMADGRFRAVLTAPSSGAPVVTVAYAGDQHHAASGPAGFTLTVQAAQPSAGPSGEPSSAPATTVRAGALPMTGTGALWVGGAALVLLVGGLISVRLRRRAVGR